MADHALRLTAASLDRRASATLRSGARLAVHSAFERALNLVDDDRRLYGIVGPRGGNGPGLIVLRDLPPSGLLGRVQIGDGAHVDAPGRLTVGSGLVVDLSRPEIWQPPELPRGVRAPSLADLRFSAALAYRLRSDDGLGGLLPHLDALLGHVRQPPPGLSLLLRTAWEGAVGLLAGWQAANPDAVGDAARRLVGLGPGQTPSGDDLLAGYLVARRRLDDVLPESPILSPDRHPDALADACLRVAQGCTTDLGFARLFYAAQGELDERSERALAALLAGGALDLEGPIRDLLAYGHSSGVDTLVGLLLGLGTAQPQAANRYTRRPT